MEKQKRVIAIGDIHGMWGCFDSLIRESIKFNPREDVLVLMGDYIDRGADSRKVVEAIMELKNANPKRVVLLRGNHEYIATDAIRYGQGTEHWWNWMQNGGASTLKSYGNDLELLRSHLLWIHNNSQITLQKKGVVFVHACLPTKDTRRGSKYWHLSDELFSVWSRDFEGYAGKRLMVVGHTPHPSIAFKKNNVVVVDSCAFRTGVLTAYDPVNDTIFTAGEQI